MNTPTMRILPIAALLAAQLGTAQAAIETQTHTASASLPSGTSFLELQQFNPAQGWLQEVTLTLTAKLTGTAKAEALGSGGLITLALKSDIAVRLPGEDASALLTFTPQAQSSFLASDFDGDRNYAGTSGTRFTVQDGGADDTGTYSFTDGAMLGWFTGAETTTLSVTTSKLNSVTGPGNLRFATSSQNSLMATVTYTYMTPSQSEPLLQLAAVPEPGSWALMFAGLGMVGWLAKRRSA